ncbi:hypothetical protein BU25DRAFT_61754 [Macroventuria anomochaeta]|uniref:Uncharacterized protein n=1 Tax=Macroventuria anomochaeta TaxID=301207 RepID=A0ACB6RZA8_9PLEO|nr:uncharacterized protein BU25DRAFT_61754 [Macroventuria anomochaeta]KAF2627350.1 hypothetical protein BU25DRAFT_61754 [Macroventuria anomochaeta]
MHPNAVVSDACKQTGKDLGSMRLVATRDIVAGEEILMEYNRGSADFWLPLRDERRRFLQEHWSFTCQCIGCRDENHRQFDGECLKILTLQNQIRTRLPAQRRSSLTHIAVGGVISDSTSTISFAMVIQTIG